MKRKTTACRLVRVFILAAMPILLSIPVWAQETALTTVVPSLHTLRVELIGEGTVMVDGVPLTKTGSVQVRRQHKPEISVLAADDSKIKTFLWGGQNVTAAFQHGTWSAPEMIADATLTVTFENVSSPPKSSDAFRSELLTVLQICSLLGLTICLLRRKREYT